MFFFLSFLVWLFYSFFIGYFCVDAYKKSLLGRFCFLFFSFYYLAIRPIFLFTGLDIPIPAYQFRYDYWEDVLLTNLLIAFWVLTITVISSFATFKKLSTPYKIGHINKRTLSSLSSLLTFIGFLITAYYIAKFGGVGSFLHQVKAQKAMSGLYIFREISSWALFLAGFLLLKSLKENDKLSKKLSVFLILLNCLVIFSWGNRTIIGFFLFLILILYYKNLSNLNLKNVFLVFCIFFIVGMGLRSIRDNINSNVTGYDYNHIETMSAYTVISLSMHWSEYDGLLLAVRDVGEKFDHRFGRDFINGFTAWIPRFIWDGKPESHKVGKWFRQVYQPEKANGWPITALGNWYVNGSILFVLVGITLNVIVIVILDKLSSYSLFRDYMVLIFGIFLLHQGVDNNFVQKIFLTFIPLVFFFGLCRIKI